LQLLKRIEAEQGDLSKYHERQAKAAAQKADLEAQLIDNQVNKLHSLYRSSINWLAEKKTKTICKTG